MVARTLIAEGRTVRRHLPVSLLVCLLAVATGLSLLGLSALVATPAPMLATTAGNPSRVRGFYDAVNATLRSGDPAGLSALLAADFVDHGGLAGLGSTRADFVRRLLALHARFPAMQLQAEKVVALDDLVVAQVRVDGQAPTTFLGVSLTEQPVSWGVIDIFRFESGLVVERWASNNDVPFLEPLQAVPFDAFPPAVRSLGLERTAVAPGGGIVLAPEFAPSWVYLEVGEVTVTVDDQPGGEVFRWEAPAHDAGPRQLVAPGSAVRLVAGEALTLPAQTRATVRNDGVGPASFVTVALWPPVGPGRPPDPPGETAVAEPTAVASDATTDLAGRMLVTLASGPSTLGFGRVVLPPAAHLAVEVPGMMLCVVERGELSLANTDGTIWSRRGGDGVVTTATSGLLRSGDAVLIADGAAGELHSGDAPVVLLVVAIAPDDRNQHQE